MVNKKKEETSILTYDDRRKELKQVKSQISENMTDIPKDSEEEPKLISTVDQRMTVVYTEEGIRLAYKNLINQQKAMESHAEKLKKQFEGAEKMPEDLKAIKEKLEALAKFATVDKAKADYENVQIELKSVNKDIDGIKNEIGSRLKF